MIEAKSERIFFQDLKVNWNNATTEYLFTQFKSFDDLKKSDYLYKNQLKDALEWVKSVTDKDKTSTKNNINNIFSIIGDRGTGKSSFEETLGNAIDNKKYFPSNNNENVFVLQKIDPTIFDGKLDIVELFVAMLKSVIDDKKNHGRIADMRFRELTSFNSVVNEVITVLKNRRIPKSAFSEKNSGMEVLTHIQYQQNFRGKINELIDLFLKVISYNSIDHSYILLQIDDLDLVPNTVTRQMMHDIVDFLKNQPKLIIFIAYREEQLINSIMDALVVENENLLQHTEIKLSDLREQSANFIEKSLPRPQRVYLEIDSATKVKDILSPFITTNATNFFDQYGDDVTLQKFVKLQVMEQIRLQVEPIDKFEYTRFIFPHSLRGALQYLEVLFKMKNYQKIVELNSTEKKDIELKNKKERDIGLKGTEKIDSVKIINQLTTLKDNVLSYKNYITSKFSEDLSRESFVILKEWLNRDEFSKNIFICTKLLSKVKELHKVGESSPSEEIIMNKQSYNSSLGDVFTALETYKAAFRNSEDCLQLIYSIKTMYSVESLIAFIEASINYYSLNEADTSDDIGNRIGLDKYMGLVRGKIMPDAYYYNDSMVSSVTMLIYSKEQVEFIRKTVYSDIAAKGEIEAKGKAALPYTVKWSQMQYREFFKKQNFISGTNYYVDPYAQLTDLDYLMKVIKKLSDANSKMYVFYSMFDLDFFVRKNYSKQTPGNEKAAWKYAYDRVNDSVTGKVTTIEEKKMHKMMVVPLFGVFEENNTRISTEFVPLFSENEISEYLEAREVINQRFANNKLIKLYKKAIDSKLAKDGKEFFKEFNKTYGLPWPTALSSDDIKRAEFLMEPGNKSGLGETDWEIMKNLEEFIIEDINKKLETSENESQDK
jgi:hypothetical protein